MKILFNADDFGLTKGVNNGIIQAYRHGPIGSTTMMMNGKSVDNAVAKAKRNPGLKIGIHLVLTYGKSMTQNEKLINEFGDFKFNSVLREFPDKEAVKEEWQTQIEAFLKTGLSLDHIDSHHHVHGWEPLKDVVRELAQFYNVPVRYVPSLKESPEILLTNNLWTNFYAEGVSELLFSELAALQEESIEVMTHPAQPDETLKKASSYNESRQKELDILCKLKVPEWVTLL